MRKPKKPDIKGIITKQEILSPVNAGDKLGSITVDPLHPIPKKVLSGWREKMKLICPTMELKHAKSE